MPHRIAFKIRCEERTAFYVYWTGDVWTEFLWKAKVYDSMEEAEKVCQALEIPRTGFRNRHPTVFKFDREAAQVSPDMKYHTRPPGSILS